MATVASRKVATKDEVSEEDKELQLELKLLVNKITGNDQSLIQPALEMMKYLVRTSTTSMTSVPKPLKYLAIYYDSLKATHKKMEDGQMKKSLADVISLLAMGTAGGEEAKKNRDCLLYCLQGTMIEIGDWGHEYIRQLEKEIVLQWSFNCDRSSRPLLALVHDVVAFDCTHHADIQACDLLMEIDALHLLPEYVTRGNFRRVCLYLASCSRYVDDAERAKIMRLVGEQYLLFGEHPRSLVAALQMGDAEMVQRNFSGCKDRVTLYQLAFICARHNFPVKVDQDVEYAEEIENILSNSHLSSYFLTLARELDIMEPKSPQDVYKSWLEPVPTRLIILGENLDSARQNLASSLVNGFVNAGFGSDTLLTVEGGSKWIYRNKEHGMLTATAALGLLHLWDVDGGLTPIDRYLYSGDEHIKAGALLALGIVNCRVRNECDPALALLGDYVTGDSEVLQVGAVLGLGMAYAGTRRQDVVELLLPLIAGATSLEVLSVAGLSCGLICIGDPDNQVPTTILNRIIEFNKTDTLKSPFLRLLSLGLSLCYFGVRDAVDVPTEATNILEEPFKAFIQTTLLMCAYAGTGDVLIIQELLHIVGEKIELPKKEKKDKKEKRDKKEKKDAKEQPDNLQDKDGVTSIKAPKKAEWDYSMGQAMATLGVAVVSMGEDIGVDMVPRIFANIIRYGDAPARRAAPLALALASASDPRADVVDALSRLSHDADESVAANAAFALGVVGAGTNDARLAATLRQLAAFHARAAAPLFMVRVAQGLVHLGKGTMSFGAVHTDRMLVDPLAVAGLLAPLACLLEPGPPALGRRHYLFHLLAAAAQPRWLLTLDERLAPLPAAVRVGRAVDVVGKAGVAPRTVAGARSHTTPVLLAAGERAELAGGGLEAVAPTLDGICVLRRCESS